MSTAPTPLQARLGLLANCCAVFMTVMDCLIVNVALESMQTGPGRRPGPPAVGGGRLHPELRQLPAGGRDPGRPPGLPAHVQRRPVALHPGLGRLRPGAQPGLADGRPRPPGHGRLPAAAQRPFAAEPHLSTTRPPRPRRWASGPAAVPPAPRPARCWAASWWAPSAGAASSSSTCPSASSPIVLLRVSVAEQQGRGPGARRLRLDQPGPGRRGPGQPHLRPDRRPGPGPAGRAPAGGGPGGRRRGLRRAPAAAAAAPMLPPELPRIPAWVNANARGLPDLLRLLRLRLHGQPLLPDRAGISPPCSPG